MSFYNDYVQPFLIGSISGSLPCLISQPVDNTKVVIQIQRESAGKAYVTNTNPYTVARQIVNQNGFFSLYKGLDSAILRQIVYCGIRMGLYKLIEDHSKNNKKRNLTFSQKIAYSLITGAAASAIANPTDVSLVRFQSDNALAPDQRRNYKNVFDALRTIFRQEGIKGYWVGASPSIARASVVNCAHLVAYNQTKQMIIQKKAKSTNSKPETIGVRLISSAISGIAVCYLSLPFDNAKTKIMKMKPNKEGVLPYNGLIDCFRKSILRQGLSSLWVGSLTYYARVAPHAMLALLLQDYLHDIFTHGKSNLQ